VTRSAKSIESRQLSIKRVIMSEAKDLSRFAGGFRPGAASAALQSAARESGFSR
jgi:hypothetical protein